MIDNGANGLTFAPSDPVMADVRVSDDANPDETEPPALTTIDSLTVEFLDPDTQAPLRQLLLPLAGLPGLGVPIVVDGTSVVPFSRDVGAGPASYGFTLQIDLQGVPGGPAGPQPPSAEGLLMSPLLKSTYSSLRSQA